MRLSRVLVALALSLVVGSPGASRAGAPQPDRRSEDFAHVCKGGSNSGLTCSVPTQATDCPGSVCVPETVTRPIRGTLTLIAHDSVTDWLNGGATNQALTAMLEVRAPDGSKQMLAATYQNLASPIEPPRADTNVVSIDMDEVALQTVAGAVNGLLFVSPEATLTQQLQTLFATTGVPVIVAVNDRSVRSADHTGDGLATVLRFTVKIQFINPA